MDIVFTIVKLIIHATYFQPMLWEWIWVGGSLLIFAMGSNAIKASKVNKITLFMGVVNAIGIIPIFYCFAVHYTDAVAYYFEPHNKIYQTWMVISK